MVSFHNRDMNQWNPDWSMTEFWELFMIIGKNNTGVWFQPIWKILVKLDHFLKWGENQKNIWNHHLQLVWKLKTVHTCSTLQSATFQIAWFFKNIMMVQLILVLRCQCFVARNRTGAYKWNHDFRFQISWQKNLPTLPSQKTMPTGWHSGTKTIELAENLQDEAF